MTGRYVDPTGKAALFENSVAAAPDQISSGRANEGKKALFSMTPRRAGTVVIECSGCKARSRISLVDLGLRLASGSAWLPIPHHPHWVRCPSCGRRQWCRVGWTD
jgi:hypothetical protein